MADKIVETAAVADVLEAVVAAAVVVTSVAVNTVHLYQAYYCQLYGNVVLDCYIRPAAAAVVAAAEHQIFVVGFYLHLQQKS